LNYLMLRRFASVAATSIALAFVLAPSVARSAPEAHVLRFTDGSGDVSTLNRHLTGDGTVAELSELTMAYFVRYDQNNQPVPELITEVPTLANGGISNGGKTITWHLRRGVRWSDGAPFDADDVIFTVGVIRNPANNELGRDGWNLITKMDTPDKYTVVFHLSKLYAPYLPTFFGTAGANPCILPKHLLATYATINDAPYNALPVGIGPFRYTAWHRGDRIELEANPYYWRGEPKLKRMIYLEVPESATVLNMLQTGTVDLTAGISTRFMPIVSALPNIVVHKQASTGILTASFNTSRPIVSDARVRQAIRLAIDRVNFVKKISHGFGVTQDSIVPAAFPFAPMDIPFVAYDPTAAGRLLDSAGWTIQSDGIRAKGGTRLSIVATFVGDKPSGGLEYIQSMLHDVGIELALKPVGVARYWDTYEHNGVLYHGDWDVTFIIWGFPVSGDLSSLFACNQFPPNGENVYRFCNSELDQAISQYNGTYALADHRSLMKTIATIISDQVPLIMIDVPSGAWVYDNHLTGFNPGVLTPYDDMMNVDMSP
jgi:peptide/nickel transport system substrate-binding protein